MACNTVVACEDVWFGQEHVESSHWVEDETVKWLQWQTRMPFGTPL